MKHQLAAPTPDAILGHRWRQGNGFMGRKIPHTPPSGAVAVVAQHAKPIAPKAPSSRAIVRRMRNGSMRVIRVAR